MRGEWQTSHPSSLPNTQYVSTYFNYSTERRLVVSRRIVSPDDLALTLGLGTLRPLEKSSKSRKYRGMRARRNASPCKLTNSTKEPVWRCAGLPARDSTRSLTPAADPVGSHGGAVAAGGTSNSSGDGYLHCNTGSSDCTSGSDSGGDGDSTSHGGSSDGGGSDSGGDDGSGI